MRNKYRTLTNSSSPRVIDKGHHIARLKHTANRRPVGKTSSTNTPVGTPLSTNTPSGSSTPEANTAPNAP
jgi:hypothetical protein